MTDIHSDALLQVQDDAGRWHAAAVGPGVLCQATEPDRAAPAVQIVRWDWGTDLVDCRDCKRRVLRAAGGRRVKTKERASLIALLVVGVPCATQDAQDGVTWAMALVLNIVGSILLALMLSLLIDYIEATGRGDR